MVIYQYYRLDELTLDYLLCKLSRLFEDMEPMSI